MASWADLAWDDWLEVADIFDIGVLKAGLESRLVKTLGNRLEQEFERKLKGTHTCLESDLQKESEGA